MKPNGLGHSLLVFGNMPTFPTPENTNPTQAERFRALELARSEMKTRTSESRIYKALRSKLLPARHYLIRPDAKVRVYR